MARRCKLTDEVEERIVAAIRLGASYKVACRYGGIGETTFYRWLQSNDPRKRQFRERVQKAEGAAALGWLAKIEEAANDGSWQAAAWKLERRYPQEYGRRVNTVEVGENSEPLTVKLNWPEDQKS